MSLAGGHTAGRRSSWRKGQQRRNGEFATNFLSTHKISVWFGVAEEHVMLFQGERGLKGVQGEKGVKGQEGPPGEQVMTHEHMDMQTQ